MLSVIYGQESCTSVRHITAEHYFLNPVSPTFHGRDVFSPTAAWLSKAFQNEAFGEEITDFDMRLYHAETQNRGPDPERVVLRVDAFGNLMTNLTVDDIPAAAIASGAIKLNVNGKEVKKMARTFGDGIPGEAVAILGSAGYLEIAVNRGNAARTLGANRGAEVTLDLS